MDKINLRELQLYQLNILKELDRICQTNNIRYFLAYGTCLGAVRHQGFIPWDDDIDVHMPCEDYLKFIEICKTQLNADYYIQSHFDDPYCFVSWGRIGVKNSTSMNLSLSNIHTAWGICIDIFPIYPYSANPEMQAKIKAYYQKYTILSLKHYHLKTLKHAHGLLKIKKAAHALIPDKINMYLFKRYFNKLANVSKETENYITLPDLIENNKYLNKNDFMKTNYLDFEGAKFPCPGNYHEYLTLLYNNYMEIPKDKTKHSDDPNVIISFNEPYTNYWS